MLSHFFRALDSSEQNRRQREELSFSLIFKSPCLYKGFFIQWSVKPRGLARGYKRLAQAINAVFAVVRYTA